MTLVPTKDTSKINSDKLLVNNSTYGSVETNKFALRKDELSLFLDQGQTVPKSTLKLNETVIACL